MLKNTRKIRRKSTRKNKKTMFGGEFNTSDVNELLSLGFTNEDIDFLSIVSPNINLIRLSLQQINPDTGNPFTPEEIMQSVRDANEEVENNENNISGISSNITDDEDDEDDSNTMNESMNMSFNSDLDNSQMMQPLNESDLNISNISSQNTSMDSDSVGGKKRKKRKNNTIKKYKNKKSYKKYSYKKNKKTKKGGQCYGRGVGANNYDPNFNIFNSNMLTLFPYKPIN